MAHDLHILNHGYHARRIDDATARIVVIGPPIDDPRVVFRADLFEQKTILRKAQESPLRMVNKIKPYVQEADRVYIWGAQDIVSCKLLREFSFSTEVRVVPDNIEFFLRFAPRARSSIRTLFRAALYRDLYSALFGGTHQSLGRLVYSLPRGTIIDDTLAFYNAPSVPVRRGGEASKCWTFVSQPYYFDYQIDVGLWVERIASILRRIEAESGQVVRIKYHQRDSLKYRALLEEAGFSGTHTLGQKCIGIFSTMLFEAALSGIEVRLIFDDVRELFGAEYIRFVDWISGAIEIGTDSLAPLVVHPDSFRSVLLAKKMITKRE